MTQDHVEILQIGKESILRDGWIYGDKAGYGAVTSFSRLAISIDMFDLSRECARYVVEAAREQVQTDMSDEKYEIGIRFAVWERTQTKEAILKIMDKAIELAASE